VPSKLKSVEFLGTALKDLKSFPVEACRNAGFQLDKVQHGEQPDDSRPMPIIGPGAAEIRIHDAAGAFRVVYVAKFDDAVYVLHAFQKKTRQTSQADIDLARKRYKLIGKP
jgi:phage-related protein